MGGTPGQHEGASARGLPVTMYRDCHGREEPARRWHPVWLPLPGGPPRHADGAIIGHWCQHAHCHVQTLACTATAGRGMRVPARALVLPIHCPLVHAHARGCARHGTMYMWHVVCSWRSCTWQPLQLARGARARARAAPLPRPGPRRPAAARCCLSSRFLLQLTTAVLAYPAFRVRTTSQTRIPYRDNQLNCTARQLRRACATPLWGATNIGCAIFVTGIMLVYVQGEEERRR